MDESKRDTLIDLARIDAHVISDQEYNEIPELTDEDFARGVWTPGRNDRLAAGRTRDVPIDVEVLARFQATGPDWEARINRVLRDASEALGAA